jgi:hypothetical protein
VMTCAAKLLLWRRSLHLGMAEHFAAPALCAPSHYCHQQVLRTRLFSTVASDQIKIRSAAGERGYDPEGPMEATRTATDHSAAEKDTVLPASDLLLLLLLLSENITVGTRPKPLHPSFPLHLTRAPDL